MSAAHPPGWYDEPSGDHALLRWWDGQAWTSLTRARSPFEPAPEPPIAAEPPRPAGDLLDSADRPAAVSRRRWAVGLVAAAVVALLVVVGLPDGGSGGRLADRRPPDGGLSTTDPPFGTSAPTLPTLPTRPTRPTPSTVTGRVTDKVARLSYDVLPGQWRDWDRDAFSGMLSTLGYYRITQASVPNGQTYWANVTSGPVSPAAASRADLRSTSTRLVDMLAREYYPTHRRTQVSQRELTVDGAAAYLVRYRAVFAREAAAEGYAAKSEEVAVLVVDTGQDLPSVLYVSLPDTVRGLWPSVDDLLSSVRLVR